MKYGRVNYDFDPVGGPARFIVLAVVANVVSFTLGVAVLTGALWILIDKLQGV